MCDERFAPSRKGLFLARQMNNYLTANGGQVSHDTLLVLSGFAEQSTGKYATLGEAYVDSLANGETFGLGFSGDEENRQQEIAQLSTDGSGEPENKNSNGVNNSTGQQNGGMPQDEPLLFSAQDEPPLSEPALENSQQDQTAQAANGGDEARADDNGIYISLYSGCMALCQSKYDRVLQQLLIKRGQLNETYINHHYDNRIIINVFVRK